MYKFKNPKRVGAELLKKSGYVEMGQFQPDVLHDVAQNGEAKGYFCANCKYHSKQDGTLYQSVCTKLKNAENSAWGCCNLWEYVSAQERTAAAKPTNVNTDNTTTKTNGTSPNAEPPVQNNVAQNQKAAVKTEPSVNTNSTNANIEKSSEPVKSSVPPKQKNPKDGNSTAQADTNVNSKSNVIKNKPDSTKDTDISNDDEEEEKNHINEVKNSIANEFKDVFKVEKYEPVEFETELWTDPAGHDRPNGKLPDSTEVTGVSGMLKIKILPEWENSYFDSKTLEADINELKEGLKEFAKLYVNEVDNIPIGSVIWNVEINGDIATLTASDWEPDAFDDDYFDDFDEGDPDYYENESKKYIAENNIRRLREYIRKRIKEQIINNPNNRYIFESMKKYKVSNVTIPKISKESPKSKMTRELKSDDTIKLNSQFEESTKLLEKGNITGKPTDKEWKRFRTAEELPSVPTSEETYSAWNKLMENINDDFEKCQDLVLKIGDSVLSSLFNECLNAYEVSLVENRERYKLIRIQNSIKPLMQRLISLLKFSNDKSKDGDIKKLMEISIKYLKLNIKKSGE